MVRSARYNRLSPTASETSGDAIIANRYMSGRRQVSNPRKRRPTEQHPLQQNEISQPQSKRQKLNHYSSRPSPPPVFWDSLSKIWLTKGALKELDRRNTQSVLSQPPPYRRVHRPVTRRFFANLNPTQSACAFFYNCTSRTLKDIKLFARHGGPDLSGLKGYPEPIHPLSPTMSSGSSNSRHRKRGSTSTSRSKPTTTNTTTTKGSKSSRSKDPNYKQKLIDAGVLPYGYKYPDDQRPPLPLNWDEINRRLAQHRSSLSPSMFPEEEYEEFAQADAEAFNEDDVKDSVLPAMLKAMGASNGAKKNVWFTNIDPITDYVAQAKPDYYYGAQPEQLNQDVRKELSKHIIPSSHDHLPAVPNLFLEAKGPAGSPVEAQLQALHDGAIGARAMQSLQSYKQDEPVYDNNAYTISSTYQSGTLKMYAHSTAQPNGLEARPEYYMHQINGWSMTGNKDTFRDGAKAFKNAIDLTREHRNAAIVRANKMVAQTIEDKDKDEDETEEEEVGTDDDKAEAESSNTMFSFDCGTSQTPSMPVEDEDESETSIDDNSQYRPPAKRSLSTSHRAYQRQCKTGKSSIQQSSKTTDPGQSNQRSWIKWF